MPTLVRGLDYYTRTTFEFIGPMENQNSTITGGGRYDYLVEEIGGPPTPGIGFGAGIERLLIAMEEEGVETPVEPRVDVFLAYDEGAPRERIAVMARRAAASGNRRGDGLRGTVAQGAAHPGPAARRGEDRRRRPVEGGAARAGQAGRGCSTTTSWSLGSRNELA